MDESLKKYIQDLPISDTEKGMLLNAFKAEEKKITIAEFKYKRTVADKTAMANILNASIEEIKKQKKIIEDAKNEINRNLTELDQQKQLVEEKNKELSNAISILKSTQKQLIQSEKMASLGELTAGIAHEIQNPLNFVKNFSEINFELIAEMIAAINAGNYQEAADIANDIKVNAEKIGHHGKRADAIVKAMLQHSGNSSGKKEPTDINALCEEYLRLSYHGLRAKDNSFNAEMHTSFDKTVGKINIIPQDFGRVLLNLFNNAFYACHQQSQHVLSPQGAGNMEELTFKPTVTVRTKKSGQRVIISVTDNGAGIPPNIIDKIFQPFFTTKPTGSGTGLGLSLSYDIVKAHDGTIDVKTQAGEGTEFLIELPL